MRKEMKMYTAAPLPFQGQKRRHVKEFARIIKTLQPALVVDLFGGSGLLSHVAKRACPPAHVVYNDYDNYCERLAHVDGTNELLHYFRHLLRDVPKGMRIAGALREAVLKRLAAADKCGYVDWLTLSASLQFSMRYANSYKEYTSSTLYNNVRTTDYTVAGYLDGLDVVRQDYRELCDKYRSVPGALFIADPPYLSTDTSTYGMDSYWKLKDYLNVLTALSGLNYVYFTSNKSQIVELCEWLDANEGKVRNIFKGASVKTAYSPTTGTTGYTDIMLYKLNLNNG
jgi:site-specific DNA-adenine methylase